MELNSLVNTLLSSDSVNSLSQATNTSTKDVQSVLNLALPLMLGGAKQQSQNETTSAGFADALFAHGQDDTSDLSSFMQNVDMEDGTKILGHLLGKDSDNAVTAISQSTGVSTRSTGAILAAAAPLLMSLLGKQSGSGKVNASSIAVGLMAASLLKNLDVGSLLGGLLGGGSSTQTVQQVKPQQQQQSLGGNLLSSLLGGGSTAATTQQQQSGNNLLGSILSNLLK